MTEDAADRLRMLTDEYCEGRLSLELYRRSRAELLDSLSQEALDAAAVTRPRQRTWRATPVARAGGRRISLARILAVFLALGLAGVAAALLEHRKSAPPGHVLAVKQTSAEQREGGP